MRRPAFGLLLCVLFAVAVLPTSLTAQGWYNQFYEVSAHLEADAETLAFPRRRTLVLVLPEAVPAGEVCVDAGGSIEGDRGRTRVRVVVSRADDAGEDVTLQRLEFKWRQADPPPLLCCRCQPLVPLQAGDAVEFRFRFFDMPPLQLERRDKRIRSLPGLGVRGWVRQEPPHE